MNRELLIRVRDKIAAHPNHYDPDCFFRGSIHAIRNLQSGTAADIAGWAILLAELENFRGISTTLDPDLVDNAQIARDLLQITTDQALRLIYTKHWPEPYKSEIHDHALNLDKARITVSYINHLIEQDDTDVN